MPIWFQPPELQNLSTDELVMTSFKWNVHNHGRTMNLKWLAEIVHTNPAWLNPETAAAYGLSDGDWIELTSFQSELLAETDEHLNHSKVRDEKSGRQQVATMRVPIVTMPGIHPKVIAMSNSCGHWQYTKVAQAKSGRNEEGNAVGMDGELLRDPDWERNMWWEDESNGDPTKWKQNTGNGWNQNRIMPIAPDPTTGQQAFHSTVVSLKKLV